MSDTSFDVDHAASSDDLVTANQDASASSEAAGVGPAGSGASPTDEEHNWASAFTGIDTRAGADNGAADPGASMAADGSAQGASGDAGTTDPPRLLYRAETTRSPLMAKRMQSTREAQPQL